MGLFKVHLNLLVERELPAQRPILCIERLHGRALIAQYRLNQDACASRYVPLQQLVSRRGVPELLACLRIKGEDTVDCWRWYLSANQH